MRMFLAFIFLFLLAALIGGLLAYPVWNLLLPITAQPIHRVTNRLGMFALAALTIIFLRRRDLANRQVLGYDISRSRFLQQMTLGLGAGVLLLAPVIAVLLMTHVRIAATFAMDTSVMKQTVKYVAQGLLTGFGVAFAEETFFRGAMFSAIRKESGLALAIMLPTLLYAAAHFLGSMLRIPIDQMNYWSGLQVALNLFKRFASPLTFVDSFAALLTLGVLLSLIRLRTGHIAGCIGLHAGGVCVIVMTNGLTITNPESPFAHWVGSYDGIIGWLVMCWIALVALAYWRISKPSRNWGNELFA